MKLILLIMFLFIMIACTSTNQTENGSKTPGTFGYDLQFLQQHDPQIAVLTGDDPSVQVIVSAKYQGKVFTSTAGGSGGRSFGWVNYKAFTGKTDDHMNAYGGENRFWLGPEGGKFSLFFKPGTAMVFDQWHTPAAVDTEAWTIARSDSKSILMEKDMVLTNYGGTVMDLHVERTISLLKRDEVNKLLQTEAQDGIKMVGYRTQNSIVNKGSNAWDATTGAPCIWMLDMFVPSPKVTILLPYREANGKVATTDYFGEIPASRIAHKDGVLYFKADGKSRGKIGLSPERAKPFAGSYDAKNMILTLTFFDVDQQGIYLNQEWEILPDPYKGDAVNAYNDGFLADGSQMGPFYEIESVSPAAFLAPGEKMTHKHTVVHLTGSANSLNIIVQKVFGVSLAEIEGALK
jgi:hypothetical protein